MASRRSSASRRSRRRNPSRWSVSWRKMRPRRSSPFRVNSLPSRSKPLRVDAPGPDDREVQPGDRQAPLLVLPTLGGLDDRRVDDGEGPVAGVVDEDPLLDADLVGGQPDAGSGVHRLDHVVGQPGERPVELGDVGAALLQTEIAEDPDGKVAWQARAIGRSRLHPQRVDLGAEAPGGTAGGQGGGEGVGQRSAEAAADQDGRVVAAGDADPGAGGRRRSGRRRRGPAGSPVRRARAAKGGRSRSLRRGRSASARRPGSARTAASRTSWRGRRVWTRTRPPAARGPTRRAARTSSHSACSPARKRGASSSSSKSRKTTSEVEPSGAVRPGGGRPRCR